MLDVVSAVPWIQWPAIPNGRTSQLLAMQFQLEQSQWLSPDEILARQFRQLHSLFQYATRHVPFYAGRFEQVDISPGGLGHIEQWRQLPLLTRRDVQCHHDDMLCSQLKEHGNTYDMRTSGSTGQTVVTHGTAVTSLLNTAILLRHHLWHKRDFQLKLAAIRAPQDDNSPREVVNDDWGMATKDVVRTGSSATLSIHSSIEEQAAFLLRHDPEYLNTYPSVVLGLCEHFAKSDLQLTKLREVRTFGEVLDRRVRATCWKVWGVPIVDTYSTQEVGQIALQCPDHEHYHVQAENVFLEVLDEDGKPCLPGQIGRVIVTALQNFAMPLIRYDVGDYAEVGESCSCGRGLGVLKRIVGRQRNLLLLPDGRRVWPSVATSASQDATAMLPILQFQLVQRNRENLEILLVTPRPFTATEEQAVERLVERAIQFKMPLKITYVSEIPRGRTGKYEDVRCELDLDTVNEHDASALRQQ